MVLTPALTEAVNPDVSELRYLVGSCAEGTLNGRMSGSVVLDASVALACLL